MGPENYRPILAGRRAATDVFWSLFWTIPGDFPDRIDGLQGQCTMMDGSVVTGSLSRETQALMVVAGDPVLAAPK